MLRSVHVQQAAAKKYNDEIDYGCKLGHINLGRGKAAWDDTIRKCIQEKIDILLTQELYVNYRRISISRGRVYNRRGQEYEGINNERNASLG